MHACATLSATNSDRSGHGYGYSGAIFNYIGTLTIDFSALAGNSVGTGSPDGGAIYSLGDGWCGKSENDATSDGNTCNAGASVTLTQSIAANNTASGGAANDIVIDNIHDSGNATYARSKASATNNVRGASAVIDGTTFAPSNAVSASNLALGALPSAASSGGLNAVMGAGRFGSSKIARNPRSPAA